MSEIKNKLSHIMKSSLKEGDKRTLLFARQLHSSIRKKEIDEKCDVSDADVLSLIRVALKQRQESLKHFQQANRNDLIEQEKAEILFLESFCPPQLTEDQVKQTVSDVFFQVSPQSQKDFGRVMKSVLSLIEGKADGRVVERCVRERMQTAFPSSS